jgi:hypothetical protein
MDTPVPAGSQVTITWQVSDAHNAPYILFFSRNGGSTWDSVAGVSASNATGTRTLQWTAPAMASAQAKLRLFQRFNQSTSNTSNDYNLVSGVFHVSPVTPILAGAGRILSFQEDRDAFRLDLENSRYRAAEIASLDGALLRSIRLSGAHGTRTLVISKAGLPVGRAVIRLISENGYVDNHMVFIRR